ncbi:uncharacterized protein V1510DRAFT_430714 [Dipodascopsis tothii]|uniref:uncharacterized protein n=1 Tax=Dipodascopsis tothii TaxID=44089 RepID=UPI0034CE2102
MSARGSKGRVPLMQAPSGGGRMAASAHANTHRHWPAVKKEAAAMEASLNDVPAARPEPTDKAFATPRQRAEEWPEIERMDALDDFFELDSPPPQSKGERRFAPAVAKTPVSANSSMLEVPGLTDDDDSLIQREPARRLMASPIARQGAFFGRSEPAGQRTAQFATSTPIARHKTGDPVLDALNSLRLDKIRIDEELATAVDELYRTRDELESTRNELTTTTDKFNFVREKFASLADKISAFDSEREEMRNDMGAYVAEVDELRQAIVDLKHEIREYQLEAEAQIQREQSYTEKLRELGHELQSRSVAYDELQSQLHEKTALLDDERGKVSSLEERLAAAIQDTEAILSQREEQQTTLLRNIEAALSGVHGTTLKHESLLESVSLAHSSSAQKMTETLESTSARLEQAVKRLSKETVKEQAARIDKLSATLETSTARLSVLVEDAKATEVQDLYSLQATVREVTTRLQEHIHDVMRDQNNRSERLKTTMDTVGSRLETLLQKEIEGRRSQIDDVLKQVNASNGRIESIIQGAFGTQSQELFQKMEESTAKIEGLVHYASAEQLGSIEASGSRTEKYLRSIGHGANANAEKLETGQQQLLKLLASEQDQRARIIDSITEIKSSMLASIAQSIQTLASSIEENRPNTDETTSIIQRQQVKIEQLEQELERLRSDDSSTRDSSLKLQHQLETAEGNARTLERRLRDDEERRRTLEAELNQFRGRVEQLQNVEKNLSSNIEKQLELERQRQAREISDLESNFRAEKASIVQSHNGKLEGLRRDLDRAEVDVDELRQEILRETEARRSLEFELNSYRNNYDDLERRESDAINTVRRLKEELNQVSKRALELEQQNESLAIQAACLGSLPIPIPDEMKLPEVLIPDSQPMHSTYGGAFTGLELSQALSVEVAEDAPAEVPTKYLDVSDDKCPNRADTPEASIMPSVFQPVEEEEAVPVEMVEKGQGDDDTAPVAAEPARALGEVSEEYLNKAGDKTPARARSTAKKRKAPSRASARKKKTPKLEPTAEEAAETALECVADDAIPILDTAAAHPGAVSEKPTETAPPPPPAPEPAPAPKQKLPTRRVEKAAAEKSADPYDFMPSSDPPSPAPRAERVKVRSSRFRSRNR